MYGHEQEEVCMKDILSAKKSCGFQHCSAFPLLFCFPVERNPISPVSDWSPLGCPWHGAPLRDRSKRGTKNVPAKAWVPARSPELNSTSTETRREASTKLFLKPDLQG